MLPPQPTAAALNSICVTMCSCEKIVAGGYEAASLGMQQGLKQVVQEAGQSCEAVVGMCGYVSCRWCSQPSLISTT